MPSKRKRRDAGTDRVIPAQPLIRSSLERFVYATERGDAGVTGHAGLLVAIEAFHALGLHDACERELHLKERERGPTEAEWLELLTMLHLAGGTNLDDLRLFKQDDGLRRIWDLPTRTSPRSALDFLKRFHDPELEGSKPAKAVIVPETPGLRALGRVNAHLVAEVQRRHPVDRATLDVDASIHSCDKKEALHAYEGGRGYQPVVVLWSEQDLIVHDQFRDGNVPAAMGNLGVLQSTLEMLPKGLSKIFVRGDTALYEHKLLRFLDHQKIEFAISADLSQELSQAISALDEDAWEKLPPRKGQAAKEERWWAEVPYVPSESYERKGERPYRYLAIRLPPREVQLDLFEAPPPPRYVAIVTNRDLPGPDLIHWQREKCGTIERAHDRLKHDVGARLFPSGAFGANAAWYRIAVIALNLFVAMGHWGHPKEWQGLRLPSARVRFLNRAGRIIRHARRYLIVLSQLALPLAQTYVEVRRALAGMG